MASVEHSNRSIKVFNQQIYKNRANSHQKRNFLETISGMFDPVVFLTATTMKMRLFLQELWKQDKRWDDHFNVENVDKMDVSYGKNK